MTESLTKETIKKVFKKFFSLEFDDMKQTENYIELLKISKKIEGLSLKQWLILKALEVMFIDNNKFKVKPENDETIKYFDYLINKKSYENDTNFKEEFELFIDHKKYSQIFEKLDITSKEKIIIEFICKISNDSKIIFYCLDAAYFMKFPNYVPSQDSFLFSGEFQDFLDQLQLFLMYNDFEKEKEYFSLEYNEEKGFYYKEYSFEEKENIFQKIEEAKTFKDIEKYISMNSIKVPIPKDKDEKKTLINDNKIEQNHIEIYSKDKEKLINFIKEEVKKFLEEKNNSLDEKLNKIQDELINLNNSNKEKYIIQKLNDQKIATMKKRFAFDIRYIYNKFLKLKEDKEATENK